jgi:anti-sigma B factor antagonist
MGFVGRVLEGGPFAVESGREGDTHVVRPRGALDLAAAEPLASELKRVEATDAEAILVDLTGVEFIDCSGIRVLVEADRRSRADGNRLRLLRGAGQVDRLMRVTGVDEILPLEP